MTGKEVTPPLRLKIGDWGWILDYDMKWFCESYKGKLRSIYATEKEKAMLNMIAELLERSKV